MESQYRDATNLNARVALQQRFSVAEQPWFRWTFDGLELPAVGRVLELGCGPGRLWEENLDRLPQDVEITLTDAFPGMLREAEDRLGSDPRFSFRAVDAREVPFTDGAFDAVVANHMLHHVPDLPQALSEIARVLRPGGSLYATTVGRNHLREMGRMLAVLDPSHPIDRPIWHGPGFVLQDGTEKLSRHFSEVSLRRYEDALVVTEARPLVDYLLSSTAAQEAAGRVSATEFRRRISALSAGLEKELAARDAIRVSKEVGMFTARA